MRFITRTIFLNYKTIIGLIISSFLLAITLHQSRFTLDSFLRCLDKWRLFGGAILVFVLTIWIQAQRTKLIWVKNVIQLNDIRSYASLIVGNFYNCLLPGNLGEMVRAWHFHKRNNVSLSNSLAAIMAEKFIDAQLYVPIVIALNIMHPPTKANYLMHTLNAVVLFILIANTCLALLCYSKKLTKYFWCLIPKPYFRKNSYKIYIQFKNHLHRLTQNRLLWLYAPIGYVMFFLNIMQYKLLLSAAGVPLVFIEPYSLLLISCTMVVVGVVPAAPSSAGVVHYGIYNALCSSATVLGVKGSEIQLHHFANASVLVHLSYIIPEITLGLIFIWKEKKWLFDKT